MSEIVKKKRKAIHVIVARTAFQNEINAIEILLFAIIPFLVL